MLRFGLPSYNEYGKFMWEKVGVIKKQNPSDYMPFNLETFQTMVFEPVFLLSASYDHNGEKGRQHTDKETKKEKLQEGKVLHQQTSEDEFLNQKETKVPPDSFFFLQKSIGLELQALKPPSKLCRSSS